MSKLYPQRQKIRTYVDLQVGRFFLCPPAPLFRLSGRRFGGIFRPPGDKGVGGVFRRGTQQTANTGFLEGGEVVDYFDPELLILFLVCNEGSGLTVPVLGASKYGDVLILNNGSTDRTGEIAESLQENTLRGKIQTIHFKKYPYASSILHAGLLYALSKRRYSYFLIMEPGGSSNPDEIPYLLNYKRYDLVQGNRVRRDGVGVVRRILSFLGFLLYNLAMDFPGCLRRGRFLYPDPMNTFRLYSKRALGCITEDGRILRSLNFTVEALSILHREGLSITSVPVTYRAGASCIRLRDVVGSFYVMALILFRRLDDILF